MSVLSEGGWVGVKGWGSGGSLEIAPTSVAGAVNGTVTGD